MASADELVLDLRRRTDLKQEESNLTRDVFSGAVKMCNNISFHDRSPFVNRIDSKKIHVIGDLLSF